MVSYFLANIVMYVMELGLMKVFVRCGEHSFLLSVPRNPHVLRVGHLCSE